MPIINTKEMILDVQVQYKDSIKAMADLQKNIKALQEQNRELRKDYNNNSEAIEANNLKIAEYKRNLQDVTRYTKNQIKAEREQEKSLDQLKAKLSMLTQEYNKLDRTEEGSAKKAEELAKKIKNLSDELKNQEGRVGDFRRNVGDYRNAILETIGVNGKFGNSIIAMTSGGVGLSGMFSAAAASVRAFGAACWGLLTNPVVLAIAGIAGAGVAFKWWYDYNKGLTEATRLTKEFTGETGSALELIVSDIQATADMFDKEYIEVLQTMDSLMAQFHITSGEAMQAINDGFVAGADLSGNMLANIQQYAPIFHDAGLNAEQMVAIIAQTRSGIFSQGGLDAISMASKKIREMSNTTKDSLNAIGLDANKIQTELADGTKTTFDIIQQVSAAMRNFGADSAEVGNVIKDVFGKQGAANGIEMLETLDKMTTSIEDVKNVTGEYGQLQEELLETNRDLESVTMDLFAVEEGGFDSVTMKAENFVKQGLLWILRVFRDARNYWNDFSAKWSASMNGMSGMAQGFGKGVKRIFSDLAAVGKDWASGLGKLFELDFKGAEAVWQRGMNRLGNIMEGKFNEMLEAKKRMSAEINAIDGKNEDGSEGYVEVTDANGSGNSGNGGTTRGGGKTNSNGSKSGSSRGGRNSSSRGGRGSRTSTTNNDKKLKQEEEKRKREEEKKRKEDEAAEKKKQEEILKQRLDMYKLQLQVATEHSQKKKDIELKLLEEEYNIAVKNANDTIHEEDVKNATLLALQQKYAADRLAIIQANAEYEIEERQKIIENQLHQYEEQAKKYPEQAEGIEMARLMAEQEAARDRINLRQAELDELAQIEGLSLEERSAKEAEILAKQTEDRQKIADAEVDIEIAKDNAIKAVTSSLGQAMQDIASENTAFAKAGKILALGELAVNTGKALSSGISSAMSLPFPSNLAAMATTIATIMANIGTATKTIKSAKFATGGLVEGAGTGTSDSISARLSNGESVINANSTGMFAPLLSAMNQIGGGVPISLSQTSNQAMGEEMLAKAFARGVAGIKPVVSVEEINKAQTRVDVLENIGSI